MDYNAPSGSLDANAGYVGKTASTIGSKVPPKAAEYPQREIVAAEGAAGIVPSNGDTTQLPQSIGRGLWLGTLGAAANALFGAIGGGVVPGAYVKTLNPWTRLRAIAAQTNTSSAVVVTVSGVGSPGGVATGPLLKKDGALPAVGDVPVGVPFDIQPDGAGNFRFAGAVASDNVLIVKNAFQGLQYFIDPVNGSDTDPTRDGRTIAKAFQTIEKAFSVGPLGTNNIVLLGDTTWTKRVDIVSNWVIIGGAATDSNVGYAATLRNLKIFGEASNSPYGNQGRVPAGANIYAGGGLSFGTVNVYVPSVPSAVPTKSIFLIFFGGNVSVDNGSVQVDAAGAGGVLVGGGSSMILGFTTANSPLGAGTGGRIFSGIGAGVDPHTSPYYRTNLTSA